MWYIPAFQVSLTDIQFMHRILDKRIPTSVTFMMEGLVNFTNFFEKVDSLDTAHLNIAIL